MWNFTYGSAAPIRFDSAVTKSTLSVFSPNGPDLAASAYGELETPGVSVRSRPG